jgi:hypothetical protein
MTVVCLTCTHCEQQIDQRCKKSRKAGVCPSCAVSINGEKLRANKKGEWVGGAHWADSFNTYNGTLEHVENRLSKDLCKKVNRNR